MSGMWDRGGSLAAFLMDYREHSVSANDAIERALRADDIATAVFYFQKSRGHLNKAIGAIKMAEHVAGKIEPKP